MNGEGIALVGPSFPARYIGGVTPLSILFADANGLLADDAASFSYNNVNHQSSIAFINGGTILLSNTIFQARPLKHNFINAGATPYTAEGIGTVFITTGAGAYTVNLPNAVGYINYVYTFKKIDAGIGAVTIDANGAQTIDGALTYALGAINKYVTIISDGANWQVIGNN